MCESAFREAMLPPLASGKEELNKASNRLSAESHACPPIGGKDSDKVLQSIQARNVMEQSALKPRAPARRLKAGFAGAPAAEPLNLPLFAHFTLKFSRTATARFFSFAGKVTAQGEKNRRTVLPDAASLIPF